MGWQRIKNRFLTRAHRREYRAMLQKWYADGGDKKFRFDYALNDTSVVLDLGGYKGQWAADLYSQHRCQIWIFEPVTVFANNIAEKFKTNDDIDVCQFGLGAISRTETIHICGASSSTYKKKRDSEQIRIVDAKQWFSEHNVGQVALVKINIEGGEFELLERLIETGLIKSLDNIQVQFHNIAADSTARMEKIQRDLEKTHTPTYRYRYIWENWKRKDASGE